MGGAFECGIGWAGAEFKFADGGEGGAEVAGPGGAGHGPEMEVGRGGFDRQGGAEILGAQKNNDRRNGARRGREGGGGRIGAKDLVHRADERRKSSGKVFDGDNRA